MQRPTARVVLVAVWLCGGSGARPAIAADSETPATQIAREHSQKGDAYYKLEKYANAIAEYEQAYLAKTDPSFLYNIAQCHRLMNEPAEAIKFYRRFLKDAPAAPNRAVAEKHVRDLEAQLDSGAPPPATAPTRTQPLAAALEPPPAVTPPPVAAGVPAPGPGLAPIAAQSTGPPPLELNAPPPSATPQSVAEIGSSEPPPAGESHPIYTRWWFWTGVGVVVLAGVLVGAAAAGHDPGCDAKYTCK